MRRPGRFLLCIVAAVLIGWGLSWGIPRAPAALARMDWFPVQSVRVEGARYLSADEVRRAAAVPANAHLWDDVEPIAARVRAHPLVEDAQVTRRFPTSLVVRVEERQPVALLATPTLEPVDRDGRRLPLDPAVHRLDLPVIRARGGARAAFDGPPPPPAIAAAAREAARLAHQEPGFWEGVSELTEEGSRDVTLEWGDPAVRLRFRAPLAQARLREAMAVLHDVSGRGGPAPLLLDLRFADQVVVRWNQIQ